MKYTPDGYGERCRFDAFCKTVLRNEARTHLRDLGRQRNRETEFSALSQQEMDKLCTVDEYPSDSFLFTAYDTPALNALKALRGAPISMGRGEIPVELCQQPSVLPISFYTNVSERGITV